MALRKLVPGPRAQELIRSKRKARAERTFKTAFGVKDKKKKKG